MEKTKKEKSHIILITVLVVLLLIVFLAFGYFLGVIQKNISTNKKIYNIKNFHFLTKYTNYYL